MNVPPGQSGRPDTPGNGAGRNASEAGLSPEPGWLLRHRVTVPEPPAGYCERRQLASRFVPTRQRVTVFAAPGGFGKTTLLAAACCSAMARGVPVAWLTLAEEDDPAALDAYIAFACRRAGIDVLGRHGAATRTAKARFLRDPRLIANFEVLTREVALERDGLPAATDGAGFAAEFYRGGNRLQHYASTAEVALERALRWGGVDAALSALDDMWAHARKAELQTLDRLLGVVQAQAVKPGHTRLTGPELEVLRRLPVQRDKQIAAALGLSSHGVRYRIRGIFRKLQVGRRAAAVRRAHALGILPPEE